MAQDQDCRTLIVVNPHGVNLRRSSTRQEIATAVDGSRVVLLETEHAGHAGEYCRQHARGFGKILVVGGDGLLMDVVNGSLEADVAIGPLPAGTASDFVKAAPGYPASLAALLAANETRDVDLGRVTFRDGGTQHFLTEAGVGLDAACLRNVPAWLRPISAKRAYDVGAMLAVMRARAFEARLSIDGEAVAHDRFQWIAVSNTPYSGDGMPIAPDARLDDGVFHVFALGDVTRREILGNFFSLRKAEHVNHPRAVYRAGLRVTLETDSDQAMCFDGDLVERTPRAWDLLPGRLKLIVPATGF